VIVSISMGRNEVLVVMYEYSIDEGKMNQIVWFYQNFFSFFSSEKFELKKFEISKQVSQKWYISYLAVKLVIYSWDLSKIGASIYSASNISACRNLIPNLFSTFFWQIFTFFNSQNPVKVV